eukprot:SAG11_NODE_1094_length_5900_cov_5.025685_1_plen_120_part_00
MFCLQLCNTEAAALLRRLAGANDKNALQVLNINAVAQFAGGSDETKAALMEQDGFGQLRTCFEQTSFVAVRTAVVQCLCVFAARPRFRDIVGVQYGFIRHVLANFIVLHGGRARVPSDS